MWNSQKIGEAEYFLKIHLEISDALLVVASIVLLIVILRYGEIGLFFFILCSYRNIGLLTLLVEFVVISIPSVNFIISGISFPSVTIFDFI